MKNLMKKFDTWENLICESPSKFIIAVLTTTFLAFALAWVLAALHHSF